eukprot:scaffold36645_cov67-Phaeocystis_antarctica.AAC.4
MQAPAQSRLLLPRLCAAALLCLDSGLAFYVCAPELINHTTECCPPPAQANAASRLLFASAIAISSSWPIRCQPQTAPTALLRFAACVAL